MSIRRFPIHSQQKRLRYIDSLPWDLLAPHQGQAAKNHQQTLEILARRGGLCYSEVVAILEDRPWKSMTNEDAAQVIEVHLARYQSSRFEAAQSARIQEH